MVQQFTVPPPKTAVERKLRILIVTDSPVMPTGLAETTRLIFSTLLDKYPEQYELKNVLAAALPNFPPDKLGYLYSPADTKRFTPIPNEEKAQLRRDLLPAWMKQDGFILGWVGRNQWRKQVWVLYKAIHYLRTGG